jgi:hypothetical protein
LLDGKTKNGTLAKGKEDAAELLSWGSYRNRRRRMRFVLKKVYPDGTAMWIVVQPGFEDHVDPNAARSPDPDRTYATPFTLEQAKLWQAALSGGDGRIEIEPV